MLNIHEYSDEAFSSTETLLSEIKTCLRELQNDGVINYDSLNISNIKDDNHDIEPLNQALNILENKISEIYT